MAIIALGIFAMSEIALSLFINEAEAAAAIASSRRRREAAAKRKSSGRYAETQSQAQSHFNGF